MITHLYEVVRQRAATEPTAIALGSQQGLLWKTVDSQQLLALVDRLADELAALGVESGDRVITWLPSSWQTPVYLFALWKLGAIVVPFDREMNQDAAARIVQRVEPRLIVVDGAEPPPWAPGELTATWWEPGTKSPLPEGERARSQGAMNRAPTGSDAVGAQFIAPTGGEGWQRPSEELAAIFFTSGTTGNPKGCMITHANLTSQLEAAGDIIPLDSSCRLASILPLSHLFELTCGLLYPIARGAAVHYVPSRRAPDILRVFQDQQITHMVAVPQLLTIMGQALDAQLREKLPKPAYNAMMALGDRLPFAARRKLFLPIHKKLGGHLRLFGAGGAALPPETQHLWERMGVRVVQGYGTSECSPLVSGSSADGSTPIGSVGRPIRGVTVKLSSEGELLVSGPNVMKGYWKDPERTAEVLSPDGWYSTGDLARLDEQGNIFLAGRAKELIVLPSGMNVWPEDVESALRADETVKDSAIMGVPTPGGGMVLHAYLIPARESDRQGDVSPIVAQANGRLAQHQRVATASWWPDPDFPRTSTLKVRRHLLPLPEAVQATAVDSTLAADDPVGQAVATVAKVPSVTDSQTLGELGLDSLAMLDLGLALEDKTGKAVGEQDLTLDMTVAQVRETLSKAPALGAGTGGAPRRSAERASANQPLWPYTWGRVFRFLRAPITLAYNLAASRTVILGPENLSNLPPRVILAGTHHAHADEPLLRAALAKTPGAEALSNRLVVATRANAFDTMPKTAAWYATLAFGLYPLRQYGEQDVSLRGLARLVQQGNPLLIFPQGKHTHPADERSGDPEAAFKPGVGHLAAQLDATVVPFGLAGTEQVMPEDVKPWFMVGDTPIVIRKGELAIAFGKPIVLEPGESPAAFTHRLQGICFRLARQAEASIGKP